LDHREYYSRLMAGADDTAQKYGNVADDRQQS